MSSKLTKLWILEVQKFVNLETLNNLPEEYAQSITCGFDHIGYMDIIFKTKQQASDYYDKYNSHQRSLNAWKTWISDWDAKTNLRYVLRPYNHELLTIKPFNVDDASTRTVHTDHSGEIISLSIRRCTRARIQEERDRDRSD